MGVELNLKEIELRELNQRRVFCDLQYTSLGEQHVAFIKKGNGSTMHLHPLCNPNMKFDIGLSFLKIAPCVACLCGFPHNDIIVFLCRQIYHSWCVLIHFKQSSKCENINCRTYMSLEWYKSFGFKEFDK